MAKGWLQTIKSYQEMIEKIGRTSSERTAAIFVRFTDGTSSMWQQDNVDEQLVRAVPLPASVFEALAARMAENHVKDQGIIRCWPYVFTKSISQETKPAVSGDRLTAIETALTKLVERVDALSKPPQPKQPGVKYTETETTAAECVIEASKGCQLFASGSVECPCRDPGCNVLWHRGHDKLIVGCNGSCGLSFTIDLPK